MPVVMEYYDVMTLTVTSLDLTTITWRDCDDSKPWSRDPCGVFCDVTIGCRSRGCTMSKQMLQQTYPKKEYSDDFVENSCLSFWWKCTDSYKEPAGHRYTPRSNSAMRWYSIVWLGDDLCNRRKTKSHFSGILWLGEVTMVPQNPLHLWPSSSIQATILLNTRLRATEVVHFRQNYVSRLSAFAIGVLHHISKWFIF